MSHKQQIHDYLRKLGPSPSRLLEEELNISQSQIHRVLQDGADFHKEQGVNVLYKAAKSQPTNIPSLIAWNLWFSLQMYNKLHKQLRAGISTQEINRILSSELIKHLDRTSSRLNQLMDKYGINPELDNEREGDD